MPKMEKVPERTDVGKGWGAVASRKLVATEGGTSLRSFFLMDGESAVIQILDNEPFCMEGFNIQVSKGRWEFFQSQLAVQKHCLLTEAGHTPAWRAAFKVLDYRGEWDKEARGGKGGFKKGSKPVEKLWLVSNTVAQQIHALVEKSGRPLTKLVLEVTRAGSGKATSYNFQRALDEDDAVIKAMDYKSESPSTEELCKPPTDAELHRKGLVGGAKRKAAKDDDDVDF